jgi:hypothetical protein
VKVIPVISESGESATELAALNKVELMLHKATHTSPAAPLTKKQKSALLEDILHLKQKIEELSPVRNVRDVAS